MKRLHKIPLIGAVILLPLSISVAQDEDQDDQEVFELSPFEVSVENDRGYLSTNAVSGTSLNTAIRDLPMPLEVINSELIEDLQANDLEEALEYSAGVFTRSFENTSGANEGRFNDNSPSATNLNNEFTNTISLRGYTVPNNQRFGFRVGAIVPAYSVVLGGSTDTITTERIEVVRGPQALLYGINVLSGIVNIVGKEPLFDPAYTINISGGNYGYRRIGFDATGPIIKQKLAYRLLASYQEDGHWTMFRQTEREDYALQMKWRITPKYDLFVEAKQGYFHQNGIGDDYFRDNNSTGNSNFTWQNPWDERITFGRDDITSPMISDLGNVWDSPWLPRTDYEYPDKLFDYGPNYRISGPDTYYDREETTITALLRARFSEHFSGEFGIYKVDQEEETFNVNLRTFSDSLGSVIPTQAPKPVFGKPPRPTNNQVIWWNNPEINKGDPNSLLTSYNDDNYLISQGVGEPFVFPWFQAFAGGSGRYPIVRSEENAPLYDDPTNSKSSSFNRRFARYSWFKKENEAESLQMRARLAYTFDYDLFNIPANHTFSVGANYIGDVVSFINANVDNDDDKHIYSSWQKEPTFHKQDVDPYYFRQSVLDMTPLRYNGETIALVATPRFNRLADFKTGNTSGDNGSSIARSGHHKAHLWYRGYYGLYQGKLWGDKLNLIAGFREDQYQVKEEEELIIIDQDRLSDVWQGSVDPITPWFIGNGSGEYKSPEGIPAALDEKVRLDYARLKEMQPEGTLEYNFDDYQKFQTGTFGFSYRIVDEISLYYLFSEGVFPNTGQRDGAYQPIDAEQTVNNELGFKFDLLDGKVSGTISFYQIKRENAVYYWDYAPDPSRWYGGPNEPTTLTNQSIFSPANATGPGSPYKNGVYYPVANAVAMEYVEAAFADMGMSDQFPDISGGIRSDIFEQWGAIETISRAGHERKVHSADRFWVAVGVDELENNPNAAVLRRAFELAMEADDPYSLPFFYMAASDWYIHNPSSPSTTGANVTFSEEGKGVDGQIILTPIPNYQVVFSYSYQKREVTSFNLVDAVDIETGINWGTEWDSWVYILGKENFEDPTRPSTFNGGSVRGLDLSFVPQYSGKLWNMYRFSDGPLDGLRIGGGVQFIGSAPTSVPIGGTTLASNVYATPDTKERFVFDAAATYRWNWAETEWEISLRISNLLDDTEDTTEVAYTTIFDTTERRRTRIYYNPRTWKLNLRVRF